MIDRVYVEEEVARHPRVERVLARLPGATAVPCRRYGEVFNRRAQSFRLQKRRPALILAAKHGRRVLETPPGYGIGARHNHYFSHLLNCVYDCRYCFLQGMYRSAHYVLFVNYEDFAAEIETTAAERLAADPEAEICFFSGYDCDSLALETVTGFAGETLPLFHRLGARHGGRVWLELRTKSTHIRPLLERPPTAGCVVAFSFTPAEISAALERGVPSVERRLRAMARLAERGWAVGPRLDPVIYHPDYRAQYRRLLADLFAAVAPRRLHSVSLGPFRLPETFFRNAIRHYPEEPLFAGPLTSHGGMVSYQPELEGEMLAFLEREILRHLPRERFFPCRPGRGETA